LSIIGIPSFLLLEDWGQCGTKPISGPAFTFGVNDFPNIRPDIIDRVGGCTLTFG